MDFKSTIDLIIKDLNDASEIIDDLKKYPGVPVLQVEYAKSKCRNAGEVIALLKNLNNILPEQDVTVKVIPQEQLKEEKAVESTPVIPVEEKPKESKPADIATPQVKEKKKETKSPEKKEPEISIADKFSHQSDLYEEQSASIKAQKDLSDLLKIKPITNLSDAIGLNDRFLFISEIFDGNKDDYSQAITRLDRAENLQDAMAIIMSYTGEKPENEAVLQLLDLVKLKLPADE
jgi:hypothetical protein